MATSSPQRGFTLIELMVTVSVIAVLLIIAIPSFETVTNSSRLTAQANEFVSNLQFARTEAVRRNSRVVLCASANVTAATPTCSNATPWTGFIVFMDDGGPDPATRVVANAANGVHETLERVLRTSVINTPINVQAGPLISGATPANRVVFRSDGIARDFTGTLLTANVQVCLKTKRPGENIRNVQIVSGSRIAVVRASDAAACGTPTL